MWHGGIAHYETAIEMQRLAESSGTAMPYVPRFHTDGRLSVVQHGVVRFLPCCEQPRGAQSLTGVSGAAAEEYKLALSLRCRLLLQCSLQDGCKVPEATRQKFNYRCDLAKMPAEQTVSFDSNINTNMPESEDRNEFNQLPTPPLRIIQFLCNDQCPQQCCTSACPWKHVPWFTKCWFGMGCEGEGCSCGFVPLHKTLDPKHSEADLARFKDQCLRDSPPPGYVLYAGLGEPGSASFPTEGA